jgi:hypothetical protein
MIIIREASRFGACRVLGELVRETSTRYVYRLRRDASEAFVDKRRPGIHVEPCSACTVPQIERRATQRVPIHDPRRNCDTPEDGTPSV